MVRLDTNFKDPRNESTFYFHTMDQCKKFLNVFKDHWCNIPWREPVELLADVKLSKHEIERIDMDPVKRAMFNLSWGFSMIKYYEIGLSEGQQDSLNKMMEGLKKKKEEKEQRDKWATPVLINEEQFKQIFAYGATYGAAVSNPGKFHGSYPVDDCEKALDYVYRLIIKGERDEECLRCQKLRDKKCEGCIDRGREVITEFNRCAFYKPMKEVNGDE